MSKPIFGKNPYRQQEENQWLSVSDLMAGLMMVFLFISVVLMRNAMIEKDKVKEIAASYQDNKIQIYNALASEFTKDLVKWDAEIQKKDLSFNFKSPEVLFGVGKTTLKPQFKEILGDFFPRYMQVINKFKKNIEEVRIEGHTSSGWHTVSKDKAYFNNMRLSQERTRSVLSYIYTLESVATERDWIKANIAAVGYSSSKLIMNNSKEDAERSRRVIFKIITNSEIQILKIIGK